MTQPAPTHPASNISPEADAQPVWLPGTRKPSAATPEVMEEYGGLLELNVPAHGIQDPTRQRAQKKRVRGRVASSKKAATQRALLRQITGNRTIAGTVPPTMALAVRKEIYRIEAEETRITNRCRDLSLSLPELFSCLAVLAPNLRRLLAEQNALWVSVPPRPRVGRKNRCLPLDDEAYVAWAAKGAEIQTFAASMLKNLTMQMAISLEICAAHLKRHDGKPPTPEQLAHLMQSHAVQEMRATQSLGAETAHIQHIAQTGQAEPIDPPDDWQAAPAPTSPVLQQIATERRIKADAVIAKAAKAIDPDALKPTPTPPPAPDAAHVHAALTQPTPLDATLVPQLHADQIMQRLQYLSGLQQSSVDPTTWTALTGEHRRLFTRFQQLARK